MAIDKTITDRTVDRDVLEYTVGDDPVLDLDLAVWDCMGTAAHVTMLSEMKLKRPVVTKKEAALVRKELGRIAASRLIARIEHPRTTPPEHILVAGRLLEGESVARL